MRSKWKINFFTSKKKAFQTFFRGDLVITERLVGKKLNLYNGKKFLVITCTEDHIGYKVGEFLRSRFFGGHPIKKKKK